VPGDVRHELQRQGYVIALISAPEGVPTYSLSEDGVPNAEFSRDTDQESLEAAIRQAEFRRDQKALGAQGLAV
jgi:hypothetical protein